MAIRKFLVTTSVADARPVMFRGASVYSMYPQITSLLSRRFGPAHAALLAEPVADPAKNTIDWYAGVAGQIQPWSGLSSVARENLKSRMALLSADIAAHAEELKASRDPHQNNIGNFLALALGFPDERSIYAIDDQPVVVCWGFTQAQGTVAPQTLTRFTAAAPVVADPESIIRPGGVAPQLQPVPEPGSAAHTAMVVSEDRRRMNWLPLLAFLAGVGLAALAAYLILFVIPPRTDVGAAALLAEEYQREVALRGERARLLASVAQSCKPNEVGAPVQGNARRETDPAVAQATGREMDERLRRAGAALTGDVVVSLSWQSTNDLDLHVLDPSRERIGHDRRHSASGGTLDVDANVGSITSEPIENIVWPSGRAPAGAYVVLVYAYNIRDHRPEALRYSVRVQNGPKVDVYSGTAQAGVVQKVIEFTR